MLNWTNYIEQIELGLFVAFCIFAFIQLYYYLRFYIPVLTYKDTKHKDTPPLSVIICARNEALNLKENLASVLEQDYPNFEVIVVNDSSTDDTDDVLSEFLIKHKNLRTTSLPINDKFSHGKKLALTVGIKAAKNEHLVFTDADCFPTTKHWLSETASRFHRKDIVLGYGGYTNLKGLLNNYIRYDTLNIALTYLGMAIAKKPYMGVGRNLAYKKDLFFKNKGFASHYGILSGDDDLFISEAATKENTAIVINKDSFTRSVPEKSWKDFFKQKMRHLTTAPQYKNKQTLLIGIEPISRAWFYTLLVLCLCFKTFWIPVVSIAGTRTLIQCTTYFTGGKKFGEKNIWLTYIIFDVYSLFFNFVTYITLSTRRKQIRW